MCVCVCGGGGVRRKDTVSTGHPYDYSHSTATVHPYVLRQVCGILAADGGGRWRRGGCRVREAREEKERSRRRIIIYTYMCLTVCVCACARAHVCVRACVRLCV